uniref:Carboxylic ester hydrolase n=1 Tax=Otus sunia TaxID=257818 RepID=A0A8C8A9Y4_9STRI
MAAGEDTLLLFLIVTVGVTALVATGKLQKGQKAEQPEVVTKYGRVRGYQFKVDAAERSVNVFLGLPFAKPPIGPLRFSEPQPPETWKGVRDATSYPPMCLQHKVQGQVFSDSITNRKEKVLLQVSEDCLYLNVYTPVSTEKKEKLPVFVWIHGGGLVFGAASSYDGSALAAFDNVVVVTIQYRLGIAGYFSTGDQHARGNWGYLDQVAALQWIQENIIHFGGDPGSVTIAGESAGGVSVSALVLSPLAKGLFHKAISESGTAVRVLFTDQPEEEARRIAAASGCEKSSSAAVVECLREKTEEEIVQITLKMSSLFISASADGVFFPKSPRQLLSEKVINAVPYMIGVNNCEFGWILPTIMKFPAYTDGLDQDVARQILQSSLALSLKDVTSEVVEQIYSEYIGKTENRAQVRDGLLNALGDHLFVLSAIEVARYHRDAGNPVYFYEFQHRPSSAAGVVPEFVKADHTDEIAFVFGKPFLAGYATEEENKLSRTVMRYWTNFARNGNPNGEGLVHWPQYDLDERYLEIDLMQKAAKKLKEHKMEFWTQLTKQMKNERREHTDL